MWPLTFFDIISLWGNKFDVNILFFSPRLWQVSPKTMFGLLAAYVRM